jgi:hypothetical protein
VSHADIIAAAHEIVSHRVGIRIRVARDVRSRTIKEIVDAHLKPCVFSDPERKLQAVVKGRPVPDLSWLSIEVSGFPNSLQPSQFTGGTATSKWDGFTLIAASSAPSQRAREYMRLLAQERPLLWAAAAGMA